MQPVLCIRRTVRPFQEEGEYVSDSESGAPGEAHVEPAVLYQPLGEAASSAKGGSCRYARRTQKARALDQVVALTDIARVQ